MGVDNLVVLERNNEWIESTRIHEMEGRFFCMINGLLSRVKRYNWLDVFAYFLVYSLFLGTKKWVPPKVRKKYYCI